MSPAFRMSNSRVLTVRNLHHRYSDGTQALSGVDFDLDADECVALLGANGSGKTTFVLHLNGLMEALPEEGTIEVCGIALNPRTADQVRSKIGLVFQDSDEQLFMPTVLEDVAFGPANLRLSPGSRRVRASRKCWSAWAWAMRVAKAPYH